MIRKCLTSGSACAFSAASDERPAPELEAGLPVAQCWAEALDEVLVGVGRVELNERHPFFGHGKARRQLPRNIGLARARWPLKDDLTLVVE